MVMGWVWTGLLLVSLIFSAITGRSAELSQAVAAGASAGVTLAVSMAGSVCLWSGVGRLTEAAGITDALSLWMEPVLCRLFPESRQDAALRRALSANVCANLLGLGNAATPVGIRAAKRLTDPSRPGYATDSLCRLVVVNTASIQLIPANVAALRAACGAASPFDILPGVWLTSLCSVTVGLIAARILGRLPKYA